MRNEVEVLKINNKSREKTVDTVVEEIPLTVYLNDKELVTILCSPDSLKELSIGFLFSAGLIKTVDDIDKIVIDTKNWNSHVNLKNSSVNTKFLFKRLYTSGCGKGIIFYNAMDKMNTAKIDSDSTVKSTQINVLMKEFQNKSEIYLKTGGTHSAALADTENILIFKEDIGRHNAIDKVVGEAILNHFFFKDKLLLTSGRISSEVIFKIQKCMIPIIISRSAPTNQAVKLAKNAGITLIGFARGNRMNIYSNPERIDKNLALTRTSSPSTVRSEAHL